MNQSNFSTAKTLEDHILSVSTAIEFLSMVVNGDSYDSLELNVTARAGLANILSMLSSKLIDLVEENEKKGGK